MDFLPILKILNPDNFTFITKDLTKESTGFEMKKDKYIAEIIIYTTAVKDLLIS